MTSQTSMSSVSHISASSLTIPIFTARNVFSKSLTISATRVELTGTTVSTAACVQCRGDPSAGGCDPANNLRHVACVEGGVAGIHTLGGEGHEEVDPAFQSARLQHRQDQLLGRTGVGSGLEDDKHLRMQVESDLLDRRDDVRHVRVFGFAQGRWHTDVDRVELGHYREIRCCAKPSCLAERGDLRVRHVGDVRTTGGDLADLLGIDIDTDRLKATLGEFDREGKADVAEADNAGPGSARTNLLFQRVRRDRHGIFSLRTLPHGHAAVCKHPASVGRSATCGRQRRCHSHAQLS